MKWTAEEFQAYMAKKTARLEADSQPKSTLPVQFRAPYPLSLNRMYRQGKGRMHISADGRAYKEQVACLARAVGIEKPLTGWLNLDLILHPVEPRDADKRLAKLGALWHMECRCIDADNALKPALDAMQGIVYVNDKQIADLRIRRGVPVPDGGMTVRVREAQLEAA